jgi:glycosyltransferase involved in cell wall biosynthesis
MRKKKPSVSVVMPVYNCEKYVELAIKSILHQTFKDFEFVIVDDASTDKTFSVLKKYARQDKRIRLSRNKENVQIANALNKAVSLSKSDIIVRMDADDFSYPKRIELQYKFLIKNPNIAIVGSNMDIMDEKGIIVSKREYVTNSDHLKRISFRYSPFAHPSVTFRKSIFEEFGGYDPQMVPCEDIDLWFKIGSKYEFANIAKTLIKYRLIFASNSHKKLKRLELLGFKIKIKAIREYGYEISPRDALFNVVQFISLWFMPAKIRVHFYDFLRRKRVI